MTSPDPPPGSPVPDLLDRDGFITSDELAGYLRVPKWTLDQWASRGGGPMFHKVSKFRRYAPADVRDWLREHRRAGGEGHTTEPAA
jgi:hypothetical protein